MSSWLLANLGSRIRVLAFQEWARISLEGTGDLRTPDAWPKDALSARHGRKAAVEASMLLEMGLASGDATHIDIPFSGLESLRREGMDLLELWSDPSPYVLLIESRSFIGASDFAYRYSMFLGSREHSPMRMGAYIRETGFDRTYHLDSQTFALLDAMDRFNALPEAQRCGDGAWLRFAEIKACAKGVGAQLDAYLESNDVVVPPRLGVTLLESEAGDLTLLPRCDGLPEEAFTGAFTRSRDGQSLYHLDGSDGRRIRVVFGEAQQQALERMRRARRIKGSLADQIRKNPDLAFEGQLDVIDPHYARRVQGIGDWKSQSIPKEATGGTSLLDATGVDLGGDEPTLDMSWPRLQGRLETPVTVEVARADQQEPVSIPLETEADADAFVGAMKQAHDQGASEFMFRGMPLAVDESFLENLESHEGIQRPQSKKFLLIYTDEEDLSPVDQAEAEKALQQGACDPEPSRYAPPSSLLSTTRLKPHQEGGVAWLQTCVRDRPDRRGALLADEMGLGKSLEVLTFAAWCLEHEVLDGFHRGPGPYRPMLLVAPLMLVENETWQQDIKKFFEPGTFGPILTLYGEQLQDLRRAKGKETELGIPLLDLNRIRQHRVVITNYDTLTNYQHSFAQAPDGHSIWSLLVTDEAQNFKTPSTRTSHALKALHPDFHIACTGTPVENRLLDVWNILDAVQPSLLGTARDFKRRYENQTVDASTALDDLRDRLHYRKPAAFILRREKSLVGGFPRKHVHEVACTMGEHEVTRHIDLLKALHRADKQKGLHLACLHELVSLYQHPMALEEGFEECPAHTLVEASSKLQSTLQVLDGIREDQEKVIIFARHVRIQRMLARVIGERFGLSVDVINGETPSKISRPSPTMHAARSQRARILQRFKEQDGFHVLVLSPFVAGVGLTITEANHVIHYGRWWNPAVESQATDRVYRIGQDREVHVHLPVLKDPSGRLPATLDERLHSLLARKQALATDFLNPGSTEDQNLRELYRELDEDALAFS